MSMFRLNNIFWIEILIFRFENNNLEFKYKFLDHFFFWIERTISKIEIFLDSNNDIQHWNVHFRLKQ
jgi:hypothetical protein